MRRNLSNAVEDLCLGLTTRKELAVLISILRRDGLTTQAVEHLQRLVSFETRRQAADSERLVELVTRALAENIGTPPNEALTAVLIDCGRFYQVVGKHPIAIKLMLGLLDCGKPLLSATLRRRIHNFLGACYLDSANYQSCLEHLDRALVLARELGNPLWAKACLANSMSALKELGHYQDAITVSKIVMEMNHDSADARFLRFQCAGNGLFCAHRLQNEELALFFLEVGNSLLALPEIDVVSKATYEYYRALYLVDTFDNETAEELVSAAQRSLGASQNPRVTILLKIPEALCDWARRDEAGFAESRRKLTELYQVTKRSRLYHDDVLRALMKVYGNATDPATARQGMRYAKELVEYTTGVKRAKFYRQLSDQGVELEPAPASISYPFDPFANVRQWLSHSGDADFPEGKPAESVTGPDAPKHPVAKHEELAAIHDDLARLRTDAILKEIRSVAYDTAENWALAAEFFDDQTGQHCFRVGHLAGMLAREIGLENSYCARIEHAARLHDIGKIGVNEMILLKPGPLDPSELTAMRAHAEVGAYMLQGAKDPVLQMAAVIAKHHHEWWNGAGYPSSLADRRIPLAARICALADVYDALTHVRPYKGAWPHRVAVEEMLNLAGVQFDPHLIRPFLKVLERYVPALAEGRIPGLDQLKANGLMASRKRLMDTISGTQP